MGFHGPKFTWSRGSLFEHINRVLCNYDYEVMATSMKVHHLYQIKFDHRPLAIGFEKKSILKPIRPFKFISRWLSQKEFGNFVNGNWNRADQLGETIMSFVTAAKKWNMKVFGNILK